MTSGDRKAALQEAIAVCEDYATRAHLHRDLRPETLALAIRDAIAALSSSVPQGRREIEEVPVASLPAPGANVDEPEASVWSVHRVDEEDGSINFEVWGGPSDPLLTVRQSEFYDAKAVAERIVRAVNGHVEMLAALQEIKRCNEQYNFGSKLLRIVLPALAKAQPLPAPPKETP